MTHGIDLLWKSPWGPGLPPLPSASGEASQTAWLDHYGGGWQELFPNAGAACTVDGARTPSTAKRRSCPGATAAGVRDARGDEVAQVQLEVRLARSPFRLQKRISPRPPAPAAARLGAGDQREPAAPALHLGSAPRLRGPFLAGGAALDVPAGGYVADPQVSPRSPVVPGARSRWPRVVAARPGWRPQRDHGRPLRGPSTGSRGGHPGLPGRPQRRVVRPLQRRPGAGLRPHLALEVFSCLWLWQELGGTLDYPWYGAAYVMGVEPHTSCPADGLAARGAAGQRPLPGPGEAEAEPHAVLFTPRDG